MPPESLVDGVFTSQSDVWAFGVLMWEITTLGQQPYPAMTNFEVLHHVSAGNRLPRPLNCPPALHQLMLSCWSVADARPSFKVCLDNIVALRSNTEDAILSSIHAGHVARRGANKYSYQYILRSSSHGVVAGSLCNVSSCPAYEQSRDNAYLLSRYLRYKVARCERNTSCDHWVADSLSNRSGLQIYVTKIRPNNRHWCSVQASRKHVFSLNHVTRHFAYSYLVIRLVHFIKSFNP